MMQMVAGTEPQLADLKIPKHSLIIYSNGGKNENLPLEEKEIVAVDGKWRRIPMDGEPLIAKYK